MEFSNTLFVESCKKDHICDFCKSTIIKGTSYYRQNNKYEGNFYTLKMCPICWKVTGRVVNDFPTYDNVPTHILEELEMYDEKQKAILDLYLRHPNPSNYLQQIINRWSREYKRLKVNVRGNYIEV